MSGKKNLHEGNILYFSLKVCKKTGTKKVRQLIVIRVFLISKLILIITFNTADWHI